MFCDKVGDSNLQHLELYFWKIGCCNDCMVICVFAMMSEGCNGEWYEGEECQKRCRISINLFLSPVMKARNS